MSAGVDTIGILGQIRSDRFAAADRTACPHLAQYAGAAHLPGTDLPLDSSLGLTPAVDSRYQLPGRPPPPSVRLTARPLCHNTFLRWGLLGRPPRSGHPGAVQAEPAHLH